LSPGELLLQGRLQSGLTQEQVAKELYMTVYKVKALELDDYNRLNSDTFARGYIRAYANLVKVDVVVALAAYDKLIDQLKPQSDEHKVIVKAENTHRGAWQFLAIIGVFFFLLWLISVWFFDNHNESQYVAATEKTSSVLTSQMSKSSTSVSGVDNKVEPVIPASPVSSSAKVAVMNTQSVDGSAMSEVTPPPVVQTSAASVAKKTSLDEINFSFRAESWLEVSDSRGDVLATELEPLGSTLKLVGVAPFDVKLGNAPGVDIQLNGKKIDVVPLTGSNVLIMKIGSQ
jgi:cytoskeleton protein RodZ